MSEILATFATSILGVVEVESYTRELFLILGGTSAAAPCGGMTVSCCRNLPEEVPGSHRHILYNPYVIGRNEP